MSTTDELIERIETGSEVTHENMVASARRAREAEQNLRKLENDLAALPANDPRREQLQKLAEMERLIAKTARENVSIGRTVLDADGQFLDLLKDDS